MVKKILPEIQTEFFNAIGVDFNFKPANFSESHFMKGPPMDFSAEIVVIDTELLPLLHLQ